MAFRAPSDRARRLFLAASLVSWAGCAQVPAYSCAASAECGEGGSCECTGYCSFADAMCPGSLRRYGSGAEPVLAGACVAPHADGRTAADLFTFCSGSCVDVSTDMTNCGGCGTICGGGMLCAGGTCQSPAPMPTPRQYLAAVTGSDGRIYAIGGFDGGSRAYTTVEAYDPATNGWQTAPSLKHARYLFAAVATPAGAICAIDGQTPTGGVDSMECYTPGDAAWVDSTAPKQDRTALAAAVGSDGRIYVIGGYVNPLIGQTTSVEAYSSASGSWVDVAPLPIALGHLAAAAGADGRIYAIGGQRDDRGEPDIVEVYSPNTGDWSSGLPLLPTPRWDLGALLGPDGRIYAIGGVSPFSGGYVLDDNVEAFSPASNSWGATPPSLPSPRAGIGVAAGVGANALIYVIGGEGIQSSAPATLATLDGYASGGTSWIGP